MAVHGRKNKQLLLDFDSHVKEIRQQFSDQVKCLDSRTENKILLIADIQEFIRKRAEVESEYAKSLDRLADRFQDRIQKQRNLYGFTRKERASTLSLWNKLLVDTKFKSKTCSNLSELFNKNLVTRLQDLSDDIQRVSRSVRETHLMLQEEVMKQVHRLQQGIKAYYTKHAEYIFAEGKLRDTELLKQKAEESPNKKGNEKKMRNIDKVKEKHQSRYIDTKLKSTRARNEYLLTLEATSSVLSKYYDHDVMDILSRFDHNYYNSFAGTLKAYCGSEQRMANSFVHAASSLEIIITNIDQDQDRLHFLEDNQQLFGPCVKFAFLGHAEDQTQQITAFGKIQDELNSEHGKLYDNIKLLQVEIMELKQGIDDKTKDLVETYKMYDNEMCASHLDALSPTAPFATMTAGSVNTQLKSNKEDNESYLLGKFREYILTQNLNTQKQARYDVLTKALGEILPDLPGRQSTTLTGKPTASQTSLPSANARKNPIKLFGTSLDDHVKDSGQDIPEIVESCVKFITKFGLNHQGIFRVSGTSQDIADMKKAFEDGRNPLAGLNHWKDINAVAGVFRAYFRELKEPLFPSALFPEYLKISKMMNTDDQVMECRMVMQRIPPVNSAVIKYLLKFINLIASHSEQNKMNAHNLAVVFGPTVIRVPDNDDLITTQGQVNVFMEFIINEFYAIFPDELSTDGPPGEEGEENDEEGQDQTDEEVNSEEDQDVECFEAEALYDFSARSAKELSFKKGDTILVFSRTNENWWDAQVGGQNGFVPARYVRLLSPEIERCDSDFSGTSSRRSTVNGKDAESTVDFLRPAQSEAEPVKEFTSFGQHRKTSDSSDLDQPWPEPPFERPGNLRLDVVDFPNEKMTEPSPPPVPSPAVEMSANLFSTIDPTCSQYQSLPPPRRALSEKSMGQRSAAGLTSARLGADKSKTLQSRPLLPQKKDTEHLVSDSLSSTITAVREAFGAPRPVGGNPPRVAAVRPLHISDREILETQSKLKSGHLEDLPPKPTESPPEPPGELSHKGSVKDRSKLFGISLAERTGIRRPAFGQSMVGGTLPDSDPQGTVTLKRASFSSSLDDPGSRSDEQRAYSSGSADPGRYPAPAVKPKPPRKSQGSTSTPELIASIHAAAALKVSKDVKDEGPLENRS